MQTIDGRLKRTHRAVVLATLLGVLIGAASLARVRQHDVIVARATADLSLHRELAMRLQTYMAEARDSVVDLEDDAELRQADRELSGVLEAIARLDTGDEETGGETEREALGELQHQIDTLRTEVAAAAKLPGERRNAVIAHISEARVQGQLMKLVRERIEDEEADLADESDALRRESTLLLALQVMIGLLLAFGVHRRLTGVRNSVGGGLRSLNLAAERLGSGALGEDIPLETQDEELVSLARSLSGASHALAAAASDAERHHERMVRLEKLSALGQLAGAVGHELRNPLGVIRNAHHYLARRVAKSDLAGDERVNEFLKLVERELDASARIISDLLDFARERPLDFSQVDLGLLITEAVELIPERPNVHIEVHAEGELPWLTLDRSRMRQVLSNVIQNAVEAIPQDRQGTVRIQATHGDGKCEIRIADDGEGIDEKDMAHIFEPLFSRKIKGTGLGLPIVRSIVEKHQGQIAYESQQGVGTTAVIQLPGNDAREVHA